MKIGLISDTHIPSMGTEPPPQVREAFKGVDVILHAGDVYIQSCIDWLEQIAPVTVGQSGMATAVEAAPRLSIPLVVELGGYTIGMVHKLELIRLMEDVYPGAMDKEYPKDGPLREELAEIFGRPVDIVVFGYTHEALVETHQGVLFVNPGSPNMVKQIMRTGSVGLLELGPDGPKAEIIPLASLGA
jgi:putative phosphoesterase